MAKLPLLSVCVPTYNHAKFIEQTLIGIASQVTDFQVEVVVGDDASTDTTARLIQSFEAPLHQQWRRYLHPQNLGPFTRRELGGKNNVMFLFSQCRGKYIALCEGDDYWVNPHKLQRQVDFLEANPSYAICHHQTTVIYEDGSPSHPFNPPNQTDTQLIDLLTDNWIVATASSVFRNVHYPFPDWFLECASGDLGIFIMAAQHGAIKYFDEPMAVYRKHRGGMTNIHTPQNRWFLENRIKMYRDIDAYTGYQFSEVLRKTIGVYELAIDSIGSEL